MFRFLLPRFAAILPLLCLQLQQDVAQPATSAAKEPPEVTRLLEKISAAYEGLGSLRLEATVTAQYDAAGRNSHHEAKFTAVLAADGRFKHEVTDELVVAADDEAVYLYFPRSLRYYRTPLGAAATQPAPRIIPSAAMSVLMDHNPSLLLALAEDPAATLRSWGELAPGQAPGALVQKRADGSVWTLQCDEETGLLREVLVDESAMLTAAGVPSVAVATRRIAYTIVESDAQIAEETIAFIPPELAQEVEPATRPTEE